ncbi:hypothetical protein Slin15195_G075480 [Septoria linicola]|uniref:Uncharacterized protein n=1 Tax=Septoria linicola TaxID=215465 RepID=A0A9Q9ART2_9PEZI|nr:hypothetical protein Slin15195_G075480 [Septoria linicola]
MAPSTRRNSVLAKKIATLQLRLQPLVPLPAGPPHPAFPKTLMAFHLLTEDELDSIAHYYHQSTPGVYTRQYPANMNWDRDFLARPSTRATSSPQTPTTATKGTSDAKIRRRSRQLSQSEDIWLQDLMNTVEDIQAPMLPSQSDEEMANAQNPYANMSDKERIRIKRRKVGKFIGLVGMETPAEEIAARIQLSLDRAVERSREEMRRSEEVMLRRKKMA